MTAYFIYKRNEGLTPTLYAVTDDKELNRIFMEERDKTLFISIKKELDKNEYKKFISSHSGYLLSMRGFETKPSHNSLSNYVSVLSTSEEEFRTYANLDTVYRLLGKFVREESFFFENTLLQDLNTIGYFNIFKFVNPYEPFLAGIDSNMDFPLKSDSLNVFLHMFGYTFKKNKEEE